MRGNERQRGILRVQRQKRKENRPGDNYCSEGIVSYVADQVRAWEWEPNTSKANERCPRSRSRCFLRVRYVLRTSLLFSLLWSTRYAPIEVSYQTTRDLLAPLPALFDRTLLSYFIPPGHHSLVLLLLLLLSGCLVYGPVLYIHSILVRLDLCCVSDAAPCVLQS